MKYLIISYSLLLSACSIRAVALVETEEAAIQGSTVIQRKQGESTVQSPSGLLETLLTPKTRLPEEEKEDENN